MSGSSPRSQFGYRNEEWGPVTATATILGKKWHTVIIYELIEHESLGFNELQEEIEDISAKMLCEGLEKLEKRGVVDRTIIDQRPTRVQYSLTEQGEALQPIIDAMREWGETYLTLPDE